MRNLFKSFLKLIKFFTRKILIDKNVLLKIIYFYLKNRFFIKKWIKRQYI